MYKILKAEKLADKIYLMKVHAPRVAGHCQPGQFVIVKMDDKGERIPLTICDYDREEGTITIVFQVVGASTAKEETKTVGGIPILIINLTIPSGPFQVSVPYPSTNLISFLDKCIENNK